MGVVIESHLQKVSGAQGIKISKKNPTIADLNDSLKAASVVDIPAWRKISFLADLRNLCSHKKDTEPTKVQVDELIEGAEWLVKSVVAWIGAEMEFALSQAVASGDAFEHRPSECGHCVQDFLADLDFRDLPGEAAGFELGADDALPTADLRFYPAALVVPCG